MAEPELEGNNPIPCRDAVSRVAERGVTFPFNYTGEWFGNLSGGYKTGAAYDGIVKLGIQLDLEKLVGWKGSTILVSGLSPHGNSITSDYVHDFNGIINIDAYDSARLFEAWFEQAAFDGKLSIRVGQLLADSEFCISNGCCLFINGAFGAIPLLSKNVDAPVYPLAAPGIRIQIAPNDCIFAQLGSFVGNAGDQTTNNRYGTRFFNGNRGALILGEIGFTLKPPPQSEAPANPSGKDQLATARPVSGTFKLGAYYDTASFVDPDGSGIHRGEYAFYLIVDQEVWHESGDPNQGMRVFGRIGGAPSERSTVNFYFDAGINYQGLFPFRDKDVCGIGLSYTKISPGLLDEGGAPVPSHHETIIEGTYQAAITSWFAIQPDIQYVFNPGATGSQRNALVAGIRFSVTF